MVFTCLFAFMQLSKGQVVDSNYIQVDSLISIGEEIDTLKTIPYHSAERASLYSAVLPGLGQAYNHKYWKIPIIYGGFATFGYFIVKYNGYYSNYRKAYFEYLQGGIVTKEEFKLPFFSETGEIERQLVNYRDEYQRYRDLNVMLCSFLYFLNIIDASVDAHFFDFDVGQNLSLNINPGVMPNSIYMPQTNSYSLSLTYTFKNK